MIEYGYINEGGYLRSRNIEEYTEQYLGADGTLQTRTVTEQEQIDGLAACGWKPVDPIDSQQLQTEDGYIVRVVPYDAGTCIKFNYLKVRDVQAERRKIELLKDQLSGSDYKVIKCYEASLAGEELPYDFTTLRSERENIRQQINSLETNLLSLEDNN